MTDLPPRASRSRRLLAFALIALMGAMIPMLLRRDVVAEPDVTLVRDGTELVLVAMMSSTCAGIQAPGFAEALETIRDHLRREAASAGHTFVTIGVATDWMLDDGVEVLRRFGPFDEILVGRGWMNSGIVKYIWTDFPGRAAVPQLVVVEREVMTGQFIEVSNARVRYRKASASQIIEWSRLLGT